MTVRQYGKVDAADSGTWRLMVRGRRSTVANNFGAPRAQTNEHSDSPIVFFLLSMSVGERAHVRTERPPPTSAPPHIIDTSLVNGDEAARNTQLFLLLPQNRSHTTVNPTSFPPKRWP